MKQRRINVAFTLLVIFLMMVLVIIYTTRLFYRISVSNIYEVGEDKVSSLAVTLENYLDTAKSVLWVTADTVDDMIKNGDDSERILRYLVEESKNQEEQFDENYTGIYGYIRGEYLDGVGWVPPEDYDVLQRDWYLAAKRAAGESTIVSPYVDAQTQAVIISFSRLLSDGESALSLDVTMNRIQSIIQNVTIKGKGYGFIVNEDGMLIAHGEASANGKFVDQVLNNEDFLARLAAVKNGNFNATINGEKSTVFVNQVMGQWYVVIVVKDQELFRDVWSQLAVNIVVYLVSFSLISLVCYFAYRNEWRYSQRVEELKISEQKQEYEAKVLRLEKSTADASNRAKGEFLAEMSHEIRTPINAVLGMNEMILRESGEETIRKYAENIKISGKTLLSIINDILDFSKIEDGKMEILPVDYDLAGMIQNLVNSVQGRAKAKELSFVTEVDPTLPEKLHGDDVRVTQVIMNLLTNAVKYTEQGTITFSVRDGGRDGGDVLLNVSVRDTGIGIREEDREKLFESFERLEEKRNRNIEGTGLGMSIVVKLLAMMGSEIKLESEYGKGSEFSFTLRQGIVSESPIGDYHRRAMLNEEGKKEKTYLYAPKSSVLVVDDNEMNLQVAKSLMKRSGIVPDLVSSGAEAIRKISEKHYDVVFLDHMMPKMDGIETLAKLKEEKLLGKDVTMIALTANAVVGAREKYLAAGFDDYLSKPIDAAQMEDKLAKYLPKEYVELKREGSAEKPEEVDDPDEILEFPAMGEEDTGNAGEGVFSEGSLDAASVLKVIREASKLGISVEQGLGYCGDDPEFYASILRDYAESEPEKSKALSEMYAQKDWKDYQILIHALKTSCKTIGAEELSEVAKSLEMASGEGEEGFLEQNHEVFLKEYHEIAEKMREVMSILMH